MKYISTRGINDSYTSAAAVIQGLANDGGLFVPESIPKLPFEIADMLGKTYQEIAVHIISSFFTDYTKEEIVKCVTGAYDEKFSHVEIAPIVKAGDVSVLELYHGKTAAFKDMALSILPYLLTTAIKKEKEDKEICILTATSGDTGKAALEGFANVLGTKIIVFYPQDGVSEIQKSQMVTQEGNNTNVIAIDGNFDDAQTGVKKIFNDSILLKELEIDGIKLSSANSINIGRLVPQVAYYVYSYIKMVENGEITDGEKLNIVVPTGNFGNILAAYYAKEMGIPLGKLICASNENNVLTDFIKTGRYDANRDFYITNSPSMDILISSNLERLLYHIAEGDTNKIKGLMGDLEKNKCYNIDDEMYKKMQQFYGGFASAEETEEIIGNMYDENKYLMDTHTAVAYKVYKDYVKDTSDKTKTIIVSTASAYKFASSVASSIGIDEQVNDFEYVKKLSDATGVTIPSGLKELDKKKVLYNKMIKVDGMKEVVKEFAKKKQN